MTAFNVLPQDRKRLEGLVALNKDAKAKREYYWNKCYFREANGWEEIAEESFKVIQHLVRKYTEVNQVQTMIDQLRKRFADDPVVKLTEIEKRVMTDGWS